MSTVPRLSEAKDCERRRRTETPDVCNGGVAHDDALDSGVGSVYRIYFATRRAEGIILRSRSATYRQHRSEREQGGDKRSPTRARRVHWLFRVGHAGTSSAL